MGQARNNSVVTTLAMTAALLQIVIAVSILFLPVISLCGSEGCRKVSYGQLDAGIFGSVLLGLILCTSVIIVTGRNLDKTQLRLRCWLAVLDTAVTVYTSWIFGVYFLPGGLLMLVAALGLTVSQPSVIAAETN